MSLGDLDWAVEQLARRRARLAPHAPLYWRPARDAEATHRRFLDSALGGGGIGFRTDDALMIATPGRSRGWTLDDVVVDDGDWDDTGTQLWDALRRDIAGSSIRFVCPTPEPGRARFAREQGLCSQASWWQLVVERVRAPLDGPDPQVDGATSALVPAPPIYDPGGAILFLTGVTDPYRALPSAEAQAQRLGSPIIVVEQPASDTELASRLDEAHFYRHCDFFTGTVH